MCINPFHGLWSKKPFQGFLRQLVLGQDLHYVLLFFPALNEAVIFERHELWFFSIFPDSGKDRAGHRCGRLQSKIRGVRMRSVSGEYRGKDAFMWALRYLDGQ